MLEIAEHRIRKLQMGSTLPSKVMRNKKPIYTPDEKDKINIPNRNGETALHIAIQKGSEAMVKILRRESSILRCVNRNGLSPLELAENLGNITIIKILSEPFGNSDQVVSSVEIIA